MIDALLRDGFAYHNSESERFAQELEAAAKDVLESRHWKKFLHLSNHTIGEHLADWPRARALAEKVLAGKTPDISTAAAWGELSAARFLAGDPVGATEAEIKYMGGVGEDVRSAYIDAKINLSISMIGSKRIADAVPIYLAALSLARGVQKSDSDRGVAVASNNLATELLETASRTLTQNELMKIAANAAHEFWLKCGTWVNEERALYLQALVANALGEASRAIDFVNASLKLIEANGEEPVDVAFLHLARANALAQLGDADGHRRDLAVAESEARTWEDAGLKVWFAEERTKILRL